MFDEGEILDGKYRVLRLLGEGGMGAVFEAEATRLHRRVAVKVLRPELNHEPEITARFQLEAQAAGRIGSRHIVDVLDLGQLPSGAPYMVMEYLDGESLRSRIANAGPMSPTQILAIALQLLDGVAAAHEAGIIHRDLKPDNVFLTKQADGTSFVKILDFGISKFSGPDNSKDFSVTKTGALMGTPHYLAPEQASGSSAVDLRTDLYATGVILYECLTGSVPFAAESFNELLFKIALNPPIAVSERVPNADPTFAALVERAMQKNPNQRFQTARDMKLALEAWARGTPFVAPEGAINRQPSGGLGNGTPARSSLTASAKGLQAISTVADLNVPGTFESWSRGGSGAPLNAPPFPPRRRGAVLLAVGLFVLSCLLAVLIWHSSSAEPIKATGATPPAAPPAASETSVRSAPLPIPDPVLVEPPEVTTDEAKPAQPLRTNPRKPAPSRAAATAEPRANRVPTAPPTARSPDDTDVIRTGKGRPIRGDL